MISRRHLSLALLAALALTPLTAPTPVSAASPANSPSATPLAGAGKFLRDLGQRTIAVLQRPAGPERQKQLQALLRQGVDFRFIGRFALGRHWRKATPAQRASYLERFTDRAVKTYAARLASQRQAGFSISGVRPAGKRDVLVQSRITSLAGGLEVDWRVRQRQGSYRVIDVVIAGVSMALTQRSEFATVIRRDGIEGLIAALGDQAKPTEMAAATAATAAAAVGRQ